MHIPSFLENKDSVMNSRRLVCQRIALTTTAEHTVFQLTALDSKMIPCKPFPTSDTSWASKVS